MNSIYHDDAHTFDLRINTNVTWDLWAELITRDTDDHFADMLLTFETFIRSESIVEAENAIHDGLQAVRSEGAVHILEPSARRNW